MQRNFSDGSGLVLEMLSFDEAVEDITEQVPEVRATRIMEKIAWIYDQAEIHIALGAPEAAFLGFRDEHLRELAREEQEPGITRIPEIWQKLWPHLDELKNDRSTMIQYHPMIGYIELPSLISALTIIATATNRKIHTSYGFRYRKDPGEPEILVDGITISPDESTADVLSRVKPKPTEHLSE